MRGPQLLGGAYVRLGNPGARMLIQTTLEMRPAIRNMVENRDTTPADI
jgi:hypothetical protein